MMKENLSTLRKLKLDQITPLGQTAFEECISTIRIKFSAMNVLFQSSWSGYALEIPRQCLSYHIVQFLELEFILFGTYENYQLLLFYDN